MLLDLKVQEKSFNGVNLFQDVNINIQDHEKIGLIGRNGVGKSTLINILIQRDQDFQGHLNIKRNTIVVSTLQEHHDVSNKKVLNYIVEDMPSYVSLWNKIQNLSQTMVEDPNQIQHYTDCLEKFSQLGYFRIEQTVQQAFDSYQLDLDLLGQQLKSLSGGQIRMIELIKIQLSQSHLALIDEPTNHMDYIAKNLFINWLKQTSSAVLVVTHDRDVLENVDKIIEIKNYNTYQYKGNYTQYLKNNTQQTINEVTSYDLTQKTIKNLEQDLIRFRRLKEKSRTPGTIRRFKQLEKKTSDQIDQLSLNQKPSFWIDQESIVQVNKKVSANYERYKTKNIQLQTNNKTHQNIDQHLIEVNNLTLGYHQKPLFKPISFSLMSGQNIRLHGRNGIGKTSLIKAIMNIKNNQTTNILSGQIKIADNIKIGLYEQEIKSQYLDFSLYEIIEKLFLDNNLKISHQIINNTMVNYLFNPLTDGQQVIRKLSGGQKARIQLIAMLINQPSILILDEPTNHLDLPSIEELEKSLTNYHGSIIYVSHDSLFSKKLSGTTINLESFDG